jgi:two-component system OmpR family response regulator
MPKHVLVVDDDPHLREVLDFVLRKEGYEVTSVNDGVAALLAYEKRAFDVVVLDVMMPEMDGLEVCRRLRARSAIPIVFLSSRDEEIDRVLGLELGGDDYVAKPFSPRELAARVKAVLRRSELVTAARATPDRSDRLVFGPISLDLDAHEASCNERPVALTVTEFGLLASLLSAPGRVLSRAQLMERAYSFDNLVTERTIDSHVKRVRKKFRDHGVDPIETVHGIGYRVRRGGA